MWADSILPPTYAVFGTVDDAGLAILQAVGAGGVAPGGQGPPDGPPVLPVEIVSASTS